MYDYKYHCFLVWPWFTRFLYGPGFLLSTRVSTSCTFLSLYKNTAMLRYINLSPIENQQPRCNNMLFFTDRLSLFLSQKVHSKPLIDTSDPVHKHKSGSSSLGLHYSQNRFIPCHRVASMPFSIVSTHEQLISNSTHPAKLPFLWKVATVVMMATSCITMWETRRHIAQDNS